MQHDHDLRKFNFDHLTSLEGSGGGGWLFVGPTRVYLLDFFCSSIQFNLLLRSYICFISLLYLDLYVLGYFNILTDRSKAMLLLWIVFISYASF